MRKSKILTILTIDDLVKFCQDQNFTQFSSKDSGYSIHVQIPCESFEYVEDEDPLTFYGNIKLMHTGKNRNKSNLTEKGAKSCLSKIAYKPVLADFTEINGERDFTYHAMEFNEDGSRTYIEKQVGCFTSDKPYMKQDPDHEDRKYIYAKVAIPREYTDAAEIIERKGGTKVSAELCINEMSYSIEDGLLLEDVDVMGVTLLGTDPDTGEQVQEGMQGAYLQIEDFSADNNSIVNNAQLKEEIIAEILNRLNDKKAFAENSKEGGKPKEMDKFNKLLEKYNKTVDDITFEYETMSDEELETAFANAFEVEDDSSSKGNEEEYVEVTDEMTEEATEEMAEEVTKEVTDEVTDDSSEVVDEFADDDPVDDPVDDQVDEPVDEPVDDPETPDEEDPDDDHQSVSAIEDEDSTGVTKIENSLEYSATYNGQTRSTFATLNEQLEALWILVNDTYGETDNEWYSVDADSEKKLVYMHGWNNHYRQSYKVKNDVFSLTGDRTRIYPMWVSEDEKKEIEKMKFNYSTIESELNSYKAAELHSQREAVIAAEDYSVMADFAEFNDLKSRMDDYSVDELTKEADLLYAKFMKLNHSTFTAKNTKKNGVVFMSTGSESEEERLPYGGLFKNFKGKKNNQ